MQHSISARIALHLTGAVILLWTLTSTCRAENIQHYGYRVLERQPHDRQSFTQGLVVDGDHLLESSGLYGKSYLQRYPAAGTAPAARITLPDTLFAEGIAIVGERLYCLTWKRGRLLLFRRDNLQPLGQKRYRGQGWGLAALDGQLVMSDGSEYLSLRDSDSFRLLRRVRVTRAGRPLRQLNDLTVIDGLVWANVWYQDFIVAIDPDSGRVVAELDLADLVRGQRSRPEEVLNGLAWDPQRQGLWVTGKYWRQRYLLELVP